MKNDIHTLPKLLITILLLFSLIIFISQKMSNFRLSDDFLGDKPIVDFYELFNSDTLK
jgi:hypothetical protein